VARGGWAVVAALGLTAAAVGLPAGMAFGLAGAALFLPRDYPPFDAGRADRVASFFARARSGGEEARAAAGETRPRGAPAPGAVAAAGARARLLEVHSEFLRRERFASALLDRYRPTVTRVGRRSTPAVERLLARTAQAYARTREELATEPMPPSLDRARAHTLRMLEQAEEALVATLDAARRRDPDFAMAREGAFARALAAHQAALDALRRVPREEVSAALRDRAS
jgi:hypothetical protein